MGEGTYATHIRRTRRIYARRLAALRGQSGRLRELLELSPTASGMHVIAELAPKLAQRMSDRDVAKLADQADVTVLPLADYYAGRPNRCALLLGFANGFLQHCENPASFGRYAPARCEQRIEHDLEMGGVFPGEIEIGDAHGVHFRGETNCAVFGRFQGLFKLDESGLSDCGEQGGFVLEMLVRGRPRDP